MESPRREAILAAALHLFADQGYDGTAVPEVARLAGVGAATLYRHFTGKEELVNTLYQRWKKQMTQALLASLSGPREPRQTFRRFWRAMAEFATEHPTAFVFLEIHEHGEYLDERSRQLEFELLVPLGQTLLEWQQQGAIRAGRPDVMMAFLFGGFVGLVRASRKFGVPLDAAALAEAEACAWASIALR
jgi:AcrR family transcriptional regulator